ncbi:MAG: peptidoglycan bridge formation glycyltransferase FemA/FemB family protein [Candidatus Methanofastidiosa archaeon]|nr:peptidoglycan bridge formation glycyltransferase FemA/FemB family protein [Candidatus Methanofastidiosa archaeon]
MKGDDPEIFKIIITTYEGIIRTKAIYSQFRNLFNFDIYKDEFAHFKYDFEDHLEIIIDLTKHEEDLWKDVHSKRRNEIRKAQNIGVTLGIISQLSDLKECYSILQEVYTRVRLPLPSFNFFISLSNNMKNDDASFIGFTAQHGNKIIGCMFALGYKNVLYDYYAGAYFKYYNKNPNDFLPWAAMLWGKNKGFTNFYFGGAGRPGVPYGVRDYKMKYGGELVNLGRFVKVHKAFYYQLGKIGMRFYRFLRKR